MTLRNAIVSTATVALLLAGSSGMALAQDYTGKWEVEDSSGTEFTITLMKDGTASATQGEGLKGTWEKKGGAAVINWDSGWTTKIMKKGDDYEKVAYAKGQKMEGEPTNRSDAEKLE